MCYNFLFLGWSGDKRWKEKEGEGKGEEEREKGGRGKRKKLRDRDKLIIQMTIFNFYVNKSFF